MNAKQSHARGAVVIGSGIGGLCCAARLCALGFDVTVLERHAGPGGKIRTLSSETGPVDAGPTVLTLKHVFEDVFADLGERLEDHLALHKLPIIARHFWPDGTKLDLHDRPDANLEAIKEFAGPKAEADFTRFGAETKALFDALNPTMMDQPQPSLSTLAATFLRHPFLFGAMAPLQSLGTRLTRRFEDPRLSQLFKRYATYVGGLPHRSPALLSLIWQAEAAGVWCVEGGMQTLPQSLEALCRRHGARFYYDTGAASIACENGRVKSVECDDQAAIKTDLVVFNGDPRALAKGALGPDVTNVARQTLNAGRSLSAVVWSFDAVPKGPDLAYHNVFFADPSGSEFRELQAGLFPQQQSIYVCAQDRAPGRRPRPGARERFEIILNAPPLGTGPNSDMEVPICLTRTFDVLHRFGLTFEPRPGPANLTRPADFEALFPESSGSLYGQSPHGLTAALKRPRARTAIKGLYLVGGGAHPGAGLPMAALSARHAVETIMQDRTSPSALRPTAMPGGISTGSATIKAGQSRS